MTTLVPVVAVIVGAALQILRAGATPLDFDEAFTANAGRLPVGSLLRFLRVRDTHPPLDYLLRAPLARAGASPLVFRLPSVLAAIAALVVFALWMRRYDRLGAVATVAFAVGSFQITYGRDARMYAPIALAGVVGARLADDWLRAPTGRKAVGIGCVAAAAMLLQAGGFALVAGFLAVPGLRRDRPAWQWRGALAAGGAVWAGVWGASFLHQASNNRSQWIPLSSPQWIVRTLNELFDITPVVAVLVVGLAAAGAVALCRSRSPLARVWLTCGLLPIALVVVIGFQARILLPRTLAPEAWAMTVALAALVDAAWRRRWLLGTTAALLLAAIAVPSTMKVLWTPSAPEHAAFAWIEARAVPGDQVAVHPAWLGPMVGWEFVGRHHATESGDASTSSWEGYVVTVGGGRPSGRIWWMTARAYSSNVAGRDVCGPRFANERFEVVALCSSAH
jgi:uncharacterized membrane protein